MGISFSAGSIKHDLMMTVPPTLSVLWLLLWNNWQIIRTAGGRLTMILTRAIMASRESGMRMAWW
jgi:hypothetical protein